MAVPAVTATFSIQFKGMAALRSSLKRPVGKVAAALDAVDRVYALFVLRRFDRYSRGGGDWPPTKDRTKGKKILVDTRLMRLGLQRGIGRRRLVSSGSWIRTEITFTNKSTHPPSGLTIADIATIHHAGLGRVPVRKILAAPDADTKTRIVGILSKAAASVLRDGN